MRTNKGEAAGHEAPGGRSFRTLAVHFSGVAAAVSLVDAVAVRLTPTAVGEAERGTAD